MLRQAVLTSPMFAVPWRWNLNRALAVLRMRGGAKTRRPARNAITGTDLKVDFRALPRVIFTSPTVAAVGLTDEQANQQGIGCECRVLPMSAVPRALVNRDTRGFVKIVAEAATGRILGATVVAEGASDVIQAAVYAVQFGLTTVQFGLTTDQVASTWAPYLTYAEGFKLAAQTFKRDVSKLSCCAA